MNFLWISINCCTLGNYIIAVIVKCIIFCLIYLFPLVLTIYGIIKYCNNKNKRNKKKYLKKLIAFLVIAIISLIIGLLFNTFLTSHNNDKTSNQTWIDCYSGVCQIK